MTSLIFNETYTNIAHIENITGSLNGITLPQVGSSYGDYLYWNGTGEYVSGTTEIKLGSNAGQIEQGVGSIAIGYQAGQTNQSTGGGFAVAIGYLAGSDNQGISAVSIGLFSGQTNQQDNCISIGNCAGQIDQGITADPIEGQAIAIGYKAAQFQQGDKSISIGDHSGQNQQHDLSIAIGSYAGNTQQSTGSIAIGLNSGYQEQGEYSIAIGYQAGHTNQSTGGSYAVAIGYLAGSENQSNSAVSIGFNAGYQNQQENCISIGNCAGQIDQGITGDPIKGQAVAIGYKAAQFQQGDKSISIGDHSGQNQQHDLSIAIGSYAGNLQQSTGSIAIGQNAGYTNLGQYSIAIGNNACQNTGVDNSIVLNAQTTALDATQSGFYVNPVRTFNGTGSNFLTYTNNEITQDLNFSYVQSQTGYVINGNLNPYTGSYYDLGTAEKPWKSIYVSTGSVFIGPTGTLQINSNGLIASDVGFAGPIIQVGSTNPGNGIVLYNNNNILYYQNQSGATGPVSIFQQANNGGLNVYYTGGNVGFGTDRPTSTVDIHGITHITDKLVIGNQNTGSIAFEKNNQTGCYIEALRYNATGNHYVYYNSSTNELVQASPLYFYAYNTGTITFTGTNIYFPIQFDTNALIYYDWHHTPRDTSFTGSFDTNAIIELSYNIQVHSTAPQSHFIAAVMYLDGSPIAGSYRSASVAGTNGEYTLSNSVLFNVSAGTHTIELKAAVDNIGVNIGGVPTIAPPSGTYTSVNFRCTRIL